MYHLEDYHLPLNSNSIDYFRQVESFHSGLKINKSVEKNYIRVIYENIIYPVLSIFRDSKKLIIPEVLSKSSFATISPLFVSVGF